MSSQEPADRTRRDTEDEDVTAHRFVADEVGEDDPEKKRMRKQSEAPDDGIEKNRMRR